MNAPLHPADPIEATRYLFERGRSASKRGRVAARHDAEVMKVRLGIRDSTNESIDRAISDFVIHCQLNVKWYHQRIRRENVGRTFFYAASIGLLLGLPFAAVYISSRSGDDGTWVTAQLTAVLAGVLALHRTLQTLLDNRARRALFGKASADLQQVLYALENRWEGKVVADEAAFLQEIAAATSDCRQIAEDEKQAFYAKAAHPSIDLAASIDTAGQRAASLFTGFKVPDRVARVRAAEATRSEQDALATKLERLLATKRIEHDALPDSDPGKQAVAASITRLATDLEAAIRDRTEAEAQLEAHGAKKPTR